MKGGRFRLIGFVNVAVMSEYLADRLFRIISVSLVDLMGEMIVVFVGAAILPWIVGLFKKSLLRLFLAYIAVCGDTSLIFWRKPYDSL
jgi:hypothetical protein